MARPGAPLTNGAAAAGAVLVSASRASSSSSGRGRGLRSVLARRSRTASLRPTAAGAARPPPVCAFSAVEELERCWEPGSAAPWPWRKRGSGCSRASGLK